MNSIFLIIILFYKLILKSVLLSRDLFFHVHADGHSVAKAIQ
jgi:hypothetical protein